MMNTKTNITVVTERGQTSIPARLRKEMKLAEGQRLLWERVEDDEIRVRVVGSGRADPMAMLGYAKRFRKVRRTAAWMKVLRAGER